MVLCYRSLISDIRVRGVRVIALPPPIFKYVSLSWIRAFVITYVREMGGSVVHTRIFRPPRSPPTSSFSVILAKSKEAGHKEVKVGKFVG